MFRRLPHSLLPSSVLIALLAVTACVPYSPARMRSNALEYLYPKEAPPAQPAAEVTLQLPVRVGLAFAPARETYRDTFTENQRQQLLEDIAAAFRARKGIGHIEIVPTTYLEPGGGFPNLDRLAASLGLDLMTLVSYDQVLFTESTRASWAYLTVVGPLFINGEKNETRTVMDAVVYDIPSRALLFRAAGESSVKGGSNPLTQQRKNREFSEQGFTLATQDLIASLQTALAGFEEQAKEGTVRGAGTPALAMYDETGVRVGSGGGGGGGALGASGLLAVLLGAAALLAARGRARARRPGA